MKKSGPSLWTPCKFAVGWLGGTFVLFLLVGEVDAVGNLMQLSLFVIATVGLFLLGYGTWVWQHSKEAQSSKPRDLEPTESIASDESTTYVKVLVTLSGLYYLAYGVIYMIEFNVGGPGAIVSAITDPGLAYRSKFAIYELQESTGRVSLPGQVITLVSVLSAPLIPFLVLFWNKLTWDIRIFGVLGLSIYVAFFLAIGTLAGLGSSLIYTGVSILVLRARRSGLSRSARRSTAVALLLGTVFLSYMSFAQGARADSFDIGYRYNPSPILEAALGRDLAVGLLATASYPTQGYQGLSYNLETPFEWTGGRGFSPAIDSYWSQYGLGQSVSSYSYPARTEDRTGWPAGQYWATIYPWLASDLTFVGAALFMFLVGRWLAMLWYQTVVENSKISLLLLCQLFLVIAFVPANNQIGSSRPAVICLFSLLIVYVATRLRGARPGGSGRGLRARGSDPALVRLP